jgi:outer membrane protein assembly factor BamB
MSSNKKSFLFGISTDSRADGRLAYVVDCESQSILWERPLDFYVPESWLACQSTTSTYLPSGSIYLGHNIGDSPVVTAIDALTGKKRWQHRNDIDADIDQLTASEKNLYIRYDDGSFQTLGDDCSVKWEIPPSHHYTVDAYTVDSSPDQRQGDSDTVFTASHKDAVFAFDGDSKEILWNANIPSQRVERILTTENKVCLNSGNSSIISFNSSNGKKSNSWKHTYIQLLSTDSQYAYAVSAVKEDSTNNLFCLDASTGGTFWVHSDGIPNTMGSMTSPGQFFYPTGEDHTPSKVIALDTQTGERDWTLETNSRIVSMALSQRRLYILSSDNTISGIDTATGNKIWNHRQSSKWDINIPDSYVLKSFKQLC